MKKHTISTRHLLMLLLGGILFFNSASAQYVTIPDTNFVNWLDNNGYAGCLNGNQLDTTCTTILSAQALSCNAVPIRDLTGVQYFKNLTYLDCSNDSVYFIPSVPAGLVSLNCRYNNLAALPSLPDSLSYLDCSFNILTSLPNLPGTLSFLDCSVNMLRALPALPVKLNYLDCSGAEFANLPALPDSLTYLDCSSTGLTSLPGLPAALQYLDCGFDSIASLPALPGALQTLKCSNNLLTTLPALPIVLQEIMCDQNQITILPQLPDSLISLLCELNQLTNLPLLPQKLQTLFCNNNQLTSMPVLPGALKTLLAGNNALNGLPAPLPLSLTDLEFGDNQVTSLPALPDSLYWFDCSNNQLASLPTLPSTLIYIRCSGNMLTAIPPLPDSLQELDCDNNPNLSCLPQLKKINTFIFNNTAITCLPDYGIINNSYPALDTIPLCGIINPNSCQPFWNISGQIFYDVNSDCIFDSTDAGQAYVKVQLDGGGFQQQVYSSYGGTYSFQADNNINYNIQPDTSNLPFVISCPSTGYLTTSLNAADSFISYNNNFALQCRADGIDVGVKSIVASYDVPRPATNFTLVTTAGDISQLYTAHCAAGNGGKIELIYTGEVTYHGVAQGALTPTLVSGNMITWDIADFGVIDDYTAFNTLFAIDSSPSVAGTQACFTVQVTTTANDYNPANNTAYFCFTIVDALDPNEKEVSPAGNIDTAQWLTYTIRFQNTGSAPAQNVRVTDTLDNNLDPSTFQLTAFSAKNITQLFGNAVVFNFPNINLPDSLTSDSASRGYIQYKIKLKGGLQPGTQIRNKADIYFDLNPAVVTNTTINAINYPTGINTMPESNGKLYMNLYPNPARDYAILETDASAVGSMLQIMDVTGNEVMRIQISSIKTQVPISALAAGVYLVKLSDNYGRGGVKKLVIE